MEHATWLQTCIMYLKYTYFIMVEGGVLDYVRAHATHSNKFNEDVSLRIGIWEQITKESI